jgi:hypothetical protein
MSAAISRRLAIGSLGQFTAEGLGNLRVFRIGKAEHHEVAINSAHEVSQRRRR